MRAFFTYFPSKLLQYKFRRRKCNTVLRLICKLSQLLPILKPCFYVAFFLNISYTSHIKVMFSLFSFLQQSSLMVWTIPILDRFIFKEKIIYCYLLDGRFFRLFLLLIIMYYFLFYNCFNYIYIDD